MERTFPEQKEKKVPRHGIVSTPALSTMHFRRRIYLPTDLNTSFNARLLESRST